MLRGINDFFFLLFKRKATSGLEVKRLWNVHSGQRGIWELCFGLSRLCCGRFWSLKGAQSVKVHAAMPCERVGTLMLGGFFWVLGLRDVLGHLTMTFILDLFLCGFNYA